MGLYTSSRSSFIVLFYLIPISLCDLVFVLPVDYGPR